MIFKKWYNGGIKQLIFKTIKELFLYKKQLQEIINEQFWTIRRDLEI